MREHDVAALTAAELEAARRELAASLALARPGSPVRVPIQARMAAIDAELAERAAVLSGLLGSSRTPTAGRRARGLRRDAPAPRCRGILVPGAAALLRSPGPVDAQIRLSVSRNVSGLLCSRLPGYDAECDADGPAQAI